jgi:dTMP kinase
MVAVLPAGGGVNGLFVVLEGLDGSGTTTQAELLTGWLSERGVGAELTREPSTGPIGGLTRSVLDRRLAMDRSALALMFAADRVDHLYNETNGIVRTLRQGTWVVSDRYVLSSLAYQAAQGLSPEWLAQINSAAVVPDLTIYIDTDVSTCLDRVERRSGHGELFHEGEQLRRVETGYKQAISRGEFIGHLVTVDGNQDRGTVAKQIQGGLAELAG